LVNDDLTGHSWIADGQKPLLPRLIPPLNIA